MHYRDRAFIWQKHQQGLTAGQIYERCSDRLGWVGPLPTMAQILEITNPGPAGDAARAAGVVPAGAAGPGTNRRADT